MLTKRVYAVVTTLLTMLLLSSCAVTTAPTEASSQTSGNTSEATSDLTSSTSSRDETIEAGPDAAVEIFVQSNSAQLRADMAAGGGEYLNTFAILLNIDSAKKEHFFAVTKTNFEQIFDSSNTSAKAIVKNTRKVIDSAGI